MTAQLQKDRTNFCKSCQDEVCSLYKAELGLQHCIKQTTKSATSWTY